MTKQFILDNTMWVIKYISGRDVLSGKELNAIETFCDVIDIDFLAEQPNEEIQKLVDLYEKTNEFISWPKFIDKLVEEGVITE